MWGDVCVCVCVCVCVFSAAFNGVTGKHLLEVLGYRIYYMFKSTKDERQSM